MSKGSMEEFLSRPTNASQTTQRDLGKRDPISISDNSNDSLFNSATLPTKRKRGRPRKADVSAPKIAENKVITIKSPPHFLDVEERQKKKRKSKRPDDTHELAADIASNVESIQCLVAVFAIFDLKIAEFAASGMIITFHLLATHLAVLGVGAELLFFLAAIDPELYYITERIPIQAERTNRYTWILSPTFGVSRVDIKDGYQTVVDVDRRADHFLKKVKSLLATYYRTHCQQLAGADITKLVNVEMLFHGDSLMRSYADREALCSTLLGCFDVANPSKIYEKARKFLFNKQPVLEKPDFFEQMHLQPQLHLLPKPPNDQPLPEMEISPSESRKHI